MPVEQITHYTSVWDLDDHYGYIGLFNDDDFKGGNHYNDPAEFMAILSMLRNESPIYFDSENQWLLAGVGLGEESLKEVGGLMADRESG